jgi:multidrug efflux pump
LLGLFFVPLFYVAIKRVFPDKPKVEAALPSAQEEG